MSEPILKSATRGRVRTLTLNRPAQLNAMNDASYDALALALRNAAADMNVAVVIVTGEGRAFCAGQDLSEMDAKPVHDAGEVRGFAAFMAELIAFPKPMIAAVNGLGIGIGLTMLPYFDAVFIDETARLRAPFATLGVTTEAGSSTLLPALIGWQATADILYTARWVDADLAVSYGLAREKTPAGKVVERANALADEIAPNPVASLMSIKRLLLDARREAVNIALAREAVAFEKLRGGPANREALAAFRERRPADFSGM